MSDGTIGDPAHQARKSDHNPNSAGVVCAIDITANGIDADWLAEHVRQLGRLGDPRVGYVIWNRRIASPRQDWAWRPYSGTSNPHTHHIHISVVQDANHYDSTRSWGVLQQEEDDMYTDADRKRDEEVANRVEVLWKDYGQKGKGVRQVIAEIAQRTSDLVTGKRPGK